MRLALLAAAIVAVPAAAQSTRDSAGIRIVENARPAWTAAQTLRLDANPSVIIGDRAGEPYELSRVAGAARLADGRIVIADGASLQLRFYASPGTFIKSTGRRGRGPGEFSDIERMWRLSGDTLVVTEVAAASIFASDGSFVQRLNAMTPAPELPPGLKMFVALLNGGAAVIAPVGPMAPRTPGARWVQSNKMYLVDRNNAVQKDLGELPFFLVQMGDRSPHTPWFAPVATFTSSGNAWHFGFGNEYAIRTYSASGRLERIVRRQWTPVRVTRADIDRFVDEWGKRWIKSTGPAAEQERRELRESPYADTVPAFAQLIADRAGRVWAREAHLLDAAYAGDMQSTPLVPSVWSVFDETGRWLGDVTMPARFLPHDIGRDYVLGVARDTDGVETVVLYRLRTAR